MNDEDKQQLEYLRWWSQLSAREKRREAIMEWVFIIGTLAASVGLMLALMSLFP